MTKTSRTGVVDRIEHDDPENINFPVVILLMENKRIEIYAAKDGFGGLEEYVGTLQDLYNSPKKQVEQSALVSILATIRDRIAEQPVSERSHHWLVSLYPSGLLRAIEEL